MFKRIINCLTFCGILFWLSPALAGAWVQDQGSWLGITSFRDYYSNNYWDSHGHYSSSPQFQKYDIDQYIEYGASKNVTVGVYFSGITTHPAPGPDSNGVTGSNDNAFLARYRLWHNDNQVISVQGYIDAFGNAASSNSPPQDGAVNTAETLWYGIGGSTKQKNVFWFFDAGAGVVQRYGQGNQGQLIMEAGWKFHQQKLWLLLQNFNIVSLPNPSNPTTSNYDQFTVAPSIIYWFKKPVAVQLGVTQDVYGRNLGQGTAPFISIWLTL